MTAAVVPQLKKEIRGLLSTWLVCLAAIVVTTVVGRQFEVLGVGTYALGAIAIGALSIGHEYNGRTLTMLLSQPIARGRLLLLKTGVLGAMLAALAFAVSWDVHVVTGGGFGLPSSTGWHSIVLFAPLLAGLFLAPWLTMVCGSPLAGAVFALAIPGAMWVAGDLASALVYGGELSQTEGARALSQDIFWRGTMVASLAAAIGGWRLFARLEAIDRRSFEVHLPEWVRVRSRGAAENASRARRRGAFWLLITKELHLQQLTFAISGLYIVSWIALLLLPPISVPTRTTMLYIASLLHTSAVPLLAGAVASAEERQLGVLGWQTLLPVAAWKQWTVKSSVAIGITWALVCGVTAVLSRLPASHALMTGELSSPITWSYVFALMVMVVSALYIGSLCESSMRALLISIPVALAVVRVAGLGYRRASSMFAEGVRYLWTHPGLLSRPLFYDLLGQTLWIAGAMAAVVLLLRFGVANQRSAERGSRRVAKQVGIVAGVFLMVVLAGTGVSAYGRAEYRRRERLETRVRVSGVVVNAREQSVTKYTVAIFGEGSGTFWTETFSRGAFIRPDRNGAFTIAQVPVGRYALVAVPELNDTAHSDSQLLERLKALATSVDVSPDGPNRLTLPLTTP